MRGDCDQRKGPSGKTRFPRQPANEMRQRPWPDSNVHRGRGRPHYRVRMEGWRIILLAGGQRKFSTGCGTVAHTAVGVEEYSEGHTLGNVLPLRSVDLRIQIPATPAIRSSEATGNTKEAHDEVCEDNLKASARRTTSRGS